MKKKNVLICLSEEAISKAKKMSKEENRSMSNLIEWMIMNVKINKQTAVVYSKLSSNKSKNTAISNSVSNSLPQCKVITK